LPDGRKSRDRPIRASAAEIKSLTGDQEIKRSETKPKNQTKDKKKPIGFF
jgi:hypothetical protein